MRYDMIRARRGRARIRQEESKGKRRANDGKRRETQTGKGREGKGRVGYKLQFGSRCREREVEWEERRESGKKKGRKKEGKRARSKGKCTKSKKQSKSKAVPRTKCYVVASMKRTKRVSSCVGRMGERQNARMGSFHAQLIVRATFLCCVATRMDCAIRSA